MMGPCETDFIVNVLADLRQQGFADEVLAKVSCVLMVQAPTLLSAEREACRRIAVQRMVYWTDEDDQRSRDFRLGVERGCSDVALAIHTRGK